MINKWKLFNFKSVRDETVIELKPLSILAGSNSSGKSTVLQSMLLIAQTLYSRVNSKSVILNGTLTRLGQFDDLRSFGSESNQILIGWQLEPNIDLQDGSFLSAGDVLTFDLETVSCDISFEADSARGEGNISQLQPRLFSCEIQAEATHHRYWFSASRRPYFEISSLERKYSIEKPYGQAFEYKLEMDETSQKDILYAVPANEILGCRFKHFLPGDIIVEPKKEALENTLILEPHLGNLLSTNFNDYMDAAINYINDFLMVSLLSVLSEFGKLRAKAL